MKNYQSQHVQQGLSLIELSVVLLILIALAGLVIPFIGNTGLYAQCTATEASMVAIRNAVAGNFEQPGYVEDLNALPARLQDLLTQDYCIEDLSITTQVLCTGAGNTWRTQPDYNPETRRGWRGPYVNNINDAFNFNALELRPPAATRDNIRVVSGGIDGVIDSNNDNNATGRADDRVLFLFVPDPDATYQSCTDLYLAE